MEKCGQGSGDGFEGKSGPSNGWRAFPSLWEAERNLLCGFPKASKQVRISKTYVQRQRCDRQIKGCLSLRRGNDGRRRRNHFFLRQANLELSLIMADQETIDEIEIGELVVQVDDGRAAADPFKLPAGLRALAGARLADAKGRYSASLLSGGDEVAASERVAEALDKLRSGLRNGYNFIKGVPEEDISDADRQGAFEAYGWEQGSIGDLSSRSRVEALAEQAVAASSSIIEAGRYPVNIRTRIANWLAVLESNQVIAGGGPQQTIIEQRDTARELLRRGNSRVRYFYCQASDALDQTAELTKIGFQARRDRGAAQPQELPDAPGTAAWNLATRELSLPVLPPHATSLRAWRQALGDDPELAGVSTGTTVSVVGFTPLTPGATYDVWVTGRNSRGDGPESNKTRLTA